MALDVKEKNLIKFIAKRLIPILLIFCSFASYMELWAQPVRLLGFCLVAIWIIKITRRVILFLRVKLFPRDPLSYGKWAIVTGATAGIGEAFAYELAACGMNVIIISRSLNKLEEVKKGILKESPAAEIRCMAYDYTDREGAEAFFMKLSETCKHLEGGLGILVNNVGMVNAVSLREEYVGGATPMVGGVRCAYMSSHGLAWVRDAASALSQFYLTMFALVSPLRYRSTCISWTIPPPTAFCK